MNKKIKVSKIEIDIDGETIKLTPEQAKELRSALDEVLGKEVRVIEKEHFTWGYRPWYPTTIKYDIDRPTVTCTTSTTDNAKWVDINKDIARAVARIKVTP